MLNNKVCLGLISKPIGIRGQVKVVSYTEPPCSLFEYGNLFLENDTKIYFNSIKLINKNIFTAFIDGVNNRNASEKYSLKKIYIDRKNLPKLNNSEYYYSDLVNSEVFDSNSNLLGIVKSVLNYGAGDFLEIILVNNKETYSNNKSVINKKSKEELILNRNSITHLDNNINEDKSKKIANNKSTINKIIPISLKNKSLLKKKTPLPLNNKSLINENNKRILGQKDSVFIDNNLILSKEATIPFNKNSIISINIEQKSIIINKDYLLI